MRRYELKYGLNPHQKGASIHIRDGRPLPIEIRNGRPGYINFLDALGGWQLVRELHAASGLPAAASFKHCSPAGVAAGIPLTAGLRRACFIGEEPISPLACAYARARGADRLSSYGDFIALSDICDEDTARLISVEVSDGIIAPGYTEQALGILRAKRGGAYNIIEIDPAYEPEAIESREVFGITFRQERNGAEIGADSIGHIVTRNKEIPSGAALDLIISLITLKYTQSNSVCYAESGQAIGIGAGQQSRVHCVRLAGDKADNWWLRQHEKALSLPWRPDLPRPMRDNAADAYISRDRQANLLENWEDFFTTRPDPLTGEERDLWLGSHTGVSLGSDAFFPFSDNIERAAKSGVRYITQPGGSLRDDQVIRACDNFGMVMAFSGLRLFHH